MRIKLPWPQIGVIEANAKSEQPAGSALEADNVRSIETTSKRVRGGPRPGLKRVTEDPVVEGGGKIQHLATVTIDEPRLVHDEKTAQGIETVWGVGTPSGGTATAVAVDLYGNAYVADGRSTIARYNPGGDLVERIELELGDDEGLCRRVYVDTDQNVYAAADGAGDFSGRFWRFEPSEKSGYDRIYTQEVEGKVVDLLLDGPRLYVLVYRDEDDGSFLLAYDAVQTTEPILLWEKAVPHPATVLAVSPEGYIYVGAKANSRRGESRDVGFDSPAFGWDPWADLDQARERIHFWVDSRVGLDGLADGDPVKFWPDSRWIGTTDDEWGDGVLGEREPPYDRNQRPLFWRNETGPLAAQSLRAPVYKTNALGGLPAVRFIGNSPPVNGTPEERSLAGNALVDHGSQRRDKLNASGQLDSHGTFSFGRGMIPWPDTVVHPYAIFMLARFESIPGIHAAFAGSHSWDQALALRVSQATSSSDPIGDIDIRTVNGHIADTPGTGDPGNTKGASLDASGIAVISIVMGGDSAALTEDAYFRVNGVTVDKFTLTRTWRDRQINFVGHFTDNWGRIDEWELASAIGANAGDGVYYGVTMDLIALIVVLGSSSAQNSPHDTAVTCPTFAETVGSSGTINQVAAAGDPSLATEVELFEGMLAHEAGVSDLLPHGHLDGATTGGAYDNHPFGGTGNGPGGSKSDPETDTQATMRSKGPIVSKLRPSTGEIVWAATGGGMGYGHVVDSNGDLITIGPRLLDLGLDTGDFDKDRYIARKILDLGETYNLDKETAAEAWSSDLNGLFGALSQPTDGDTFTVDATTYMWKDTDVGTAPGSANQVSIQAGMFHDRAYCYGSTTVEPSNGDTITVGSVVYTWVTGAVSSAYDIGIDFCKVAGVWKPSIAVQVVHQAMLGNDTHAAVGTGTLVNPDAYNEFHGNGIEFHAIIDGEAGNAIDVLCDYGDFFFADVGRTVVVTTLQNGDSEWWPPLAVQAMAAAINADPTYLSWAYGSGTAANATVKAEYSGSQVHLIAKASGSSGNSITVGASWTLAGPAAPFEWYEDKDATISTTTLAGGSDEGFTWGYVAVDENEAPTYPYTQLSLDEQDRLWWPIQSKAGGSRFFVLETVNGTLEYEHRLRVGMTPYALTHAPKTKDFYDSLGVLIEAPEFAYVAGDRGSASGSSTNLLKLRVIGTARNTSAGSTPKRRHDVAVCGGEVHEVTNGAIGAKIGALDSGSDFIRSVQAFGELFLLDGTTYKVWNPRKGTWRDWKAAGAGEIPPRCKILTLWNGRIVLAQGDDPYLVHFGKQGDPYDWDQAPAVITADQAVTADRSLIGRARDIVTALIPWSDDLLLVGGTETMFRATGDPMAGGQLDLISDVTGVASGHAWCKDDQGRVFFFGSRGGLYLWGSDGPKRLSDYAMPERLENVDLGANQVLLAWDDLRRGVWVFVTPYGAVIAPGIGFFWEAKTNGWWPDSYSHVDVTPTAATLVSADGYQDRAVLVGCADGRIRVFDDRQADDDGHPIHARVRWMLQDPQGWRRMRARGFQVELADELDGCRYKLFGAPSPQGPWRETARGDVAPGLNGRLHGVARGGAVAIELYSAAVGERWGYEAATVNVHPLGRRTVDG